MQKRKTWVLVVEDDVEFAGVITERLEMEGYGVLVARKSSDALKMMTNQKFGCLVLDLQLESGRGDQVALAARREGVLNEQTPIVLVTGSVEHEVIQKIGRSLSGAFIKPFDLEEFIAKMKKLLAASEAQQEEGAKLRAA